MAYNKKTWKARQGLGLNKFSIDGATPVPIINQPDSVTQQGDALSAGNLNDLEQRIADAFDDVEESKADKSTTDALQSQINQHESRLENLEQKAGDYTTVQYRGTNAVPTGKAKNGLVEKIVGKTRAWNQLVKNGNFASGDGWVLESGVTASFSGNVATISSTTSSNGIRREIDFINGHKYLVSAEINTESALAVKFGSSSSGGAQVQITTSVFNQFVKYSEIKTASADSYQFYIFVSGTYSNLKVRNVTLYDLTLIFGSGNEPSTVAEALAQLPALGQYNAYDAGSLVSTEVSGVESRSRNLFDKTQIKDTTYGTPTIEGERISVTGTYYCSFNINLEAGQYYIKFTVVSYTGSRGVRLQYEDGTLVDTLTSSGLVTLTKKATAVLLYCGSGSSATSVYEEICINKSDSLNGTFTPFFTDTLTLSETVKLKSAGNVADTDELNVEVNGVARRRQTEKTYSVDLSTLSWTYDSDFSAWRSANGTPSGLKNRGMAISSYYLATTKNGNNLADGELTTYWNWFGANVTIYIKNGSSSVTPTGNLVYELATPVVTLLDPVLDNFIEVECGGTVETIQTQTPVIDNCLDVGYLTV